MKTLIYVKYKGKMRLINVNNEYENCKRQYDTQKKIFLGRGNYLVDYLGYLTILFKNVINKKYDLLNNNLKIVKKHRDTISEIIFDSKEKMTDMGYKGSLEDMCENYNLCEKVVETILEKNYIDIA